MANTIKVGGNFIYVIFDGSTDLDFAAAPINKPRGVQLQSINMRSNAANDVLIVRLGSATGVPIFDGKDVSGSGLIRFYNRNCVPYVVGTEVSASVRVIFEFD